MKTKKLISIILSLMMVMTMMPNVVSYAETTSSASTTVDDAVVLTKELIITEEGMPNELKLEAYVTGSLEQSSGSSPADIVLVLDQSGSMDDSITSDGVTKTKLQIMKEAVTAFTDKVAELNTNGDGSDYRVAIVGFGSADTNTEILTTDPIRTYSYLTENAQFEYTVVTTTLDTDSVYYIESTSGYEEIEYYNYTLLTDGWYTDGGFFGGDRIDVSTTTVYSRTAYPSEEYANAFVNCTSTAVAENGKVYEAIAALDGNGATRTDLGMEMADYILNAQPYGTYDARKKIVVVLTDGVPTTSNTFNATVANNAIGYAKEMKDNGAEVFALYFGNPSDDSKNFMQGMSSNYPDATAYTNLGTQAKTTYYSAHNNASAITGVFNDIVYSIAANAQLDEAAVLQDELTKYFKLPDTVAGDIKDEIRVYTADKTATGWGEEELFEDAIVEISEDNKTISVSGFDYAYYCVTEESKSQTITDYGKKLIVYIPIIADETADTIGGYLPTNVHAGVYEDDIAVETDSAAVTADGHADDVDLAYVMENAEIFEHIGTDSSYEFIFNAENMDTILDEMFLVVPDGENNTGVRLDYRIYDTNADQSSGSDDTLVATLEVAPEDATDITDISNWTFETGMDASTITIPSGANSASKVYAIVCRAYNTNPAYAQNPVYGMTYGLLNVTVVNENVHIVGGVIDDGGTVAVPSGASGTITNDMGDNPIGYTEEVSEGGDSAEMTFTLSEGYEFRRIIEKTSVNSALDTVTVLYDKDTGENNVTFEPDGSYKYQITNATGGQIVEVYTQLKQFALTTESGEHSLIMDGRTYDYNATEKLPVPFTAKEGYEITSVKYGKTETEAVEILGMPQTELDSLGIELKSTSTASGYAANGTPETDLIQGEVLVPRTQDNYVAITASPRNYKLTYKQYKRVVDHVETTYEPYGTDEEYYVEYNLALPQAPVEPGEETEISGDNYTVSDWYKEHPNNEFTGLTDVATALMPASDMTLHAFWTNNPSIEIQIPVSKTIDGAMSGQSEFKIVGAYHEHLVGEATLTVSDTSKTASATLTMLLTDKQYDAFVDGQVIRITESDEVGGNWLYDTTEYTVHYNASGDPIIKKGDQTVTSADFTNYYNSYKVEYDLNGGEYLGAASIPTKTVKYDDTNLIPVDPVEKDGYTFTGWKYNTTDVTSRTSYKDLAGAKNVFSITLVAQFDQIEYNDVIYDGNIDPVRADKYIIVRPNGGTWEHDGHTYVDEVKLLMDTDRTLLDPTRDKYAFTGWSKEAGGGDVTYIYTAQWEKDEIGEVTPDVPDNIPDIYQKKITFKIVNGTWNGTDSADKVYVVTLKDASGANSASGEANISAIIPTGMVENTGYETPGAWRETPPATVSGTDEVEYTYVFHKTPDVVYDEYQDDEPEPIPTTEEYQVAEKIKVDPNGGIWNYGGQGYTEPQIIAMQDNIDLGIPVRDGYVFMGWKQTEGDGDIVHVYTAQWEKDEIGTIDPEDGDGVADIYQKKITFKVVYGTWADDTTADIVTVVNLLDADGKYSKTGDADISAIIPTGMKANSGYRNGSWDNVPESPASGTDAVVYTHLFEKIPGGGGGGGTRYTLTYETNGGNKIPAEKYASGITVKIVKVPHKAGYAFEGWYLDEALTENVREVKMTGNITVYASWVKDNGGAGNGHETPGSLNGEDHFAYVIGYPDDTVRPNANITRAEVTAIFFRLLKSEIREQNLVFENGFGDVKAEEWYNTAVSTMAKLGVVEGRTDAEFDPNYNITRAEFAAICARFDDSEYEVNDNFKDVAGHWAEKEIHEAAAHGWIKGYDDGTFKPNQFITRAEAMTMINRVLNRVPETTDDLLTDMIKWSDNSDENAWYYLAVQEATNSHDYDMKNHIYEKWTALNEVTDWEKYE